MLLCSTCLKLQRLEDLLLKFRELIEKQPTMLRWLGSPQWN